MTSTLSSSPHGMLLRSSSRQNLHSPMLGRPDLTRTATNSPWSRFLSPSLFTTSGCRSTTQKPKDGGAGGEGQEGSEHATGVYTLDNEQNPFEQSFSVSKPASEAGAANDQPARDESTEIARTISMQQIGPEKPAGLDVPAVPPPHLAETRRSSRSSSTSVDAISSFSGSTSGTDLTAESQHPIKTNLQVSQFSIAPSTASLEQLHRQLAATSRAASQGSTVFHYQPAPTPLKPSADLRFGVQPHDVAPVPNVESPLRRHSRRLSQTAADRPDLTTGYQSFSSGSTSASGPVPNAFSAVNAHLESINEVQQPVRSSGRKRKRRLSFEDEEVEEIDHGDVGDVIVDNDDDGVMDDFAAGGSWRKAAKKAARPKAPVAPPSSTAESVADGSEAGDLEDVIVGGKKLEGRAAALERNRLAAIRSRQKKKDRVEGLQRSVTTYTAANAHLQAEALELYAEVRSLRQALTSMHPSSQCQCQHVQGYVKREQSGQGIPLIERLAGDVLTRQFVPGITDDVTVRPCSRDGEQVEKWREQVRREKEDMEKKGKRAAVVDEQHAIPIRRVKRE